jgi:hypothetical protein
MKHRLLFCSILLLTVMVYLPGLPGFFVYDDYPNLLRHTAFQVPISGWHDVARVLQEGLSSPLGRPLSLLSFAANHALGGGFDPFALKLTNIAIHLANGVLLYFLARLWAEQWPQPKVTPELARRIALVCMAFWLLHPLNLTSVLYVVQRMNSLSAFFVLSGLLAYTHARVMHRSGRSARVLLAVSLLIAWPAAVLSKENGILMVLYAMVVESTIFLGSGGGRARRECRVFFAVGLLPFVAAMVYLLVEPGVITDGYSGRDFTLAERLLTESRVLWIYVGLLLLPDPGRMSLYHDDIAISTGLLAPPTTLLAVVSMGAVILVAITLRRRLPLLAFAVAWFLVGHLVESTVIALRIAQEHRNYLPQIGLLFPLAFLINDRVQNLRWRWLPTLLVVLVLAAATLSRSITWSDYDRFVASGLANHPDSRTAQTNALKHLVDRADRNPAAAPTLLSEALERIETLERLERAAMPLPGLYRLLVESRLASVELQNRQLTDTSDLRRRLQSARLTPLETNLLGHAVNCVITRRCNMAARELDDLLAAALMNGQNPGRVRANLYGARADLNFAVLGDLRRAIGYLEQAARLDPRIGSYTLRWIELLIINGQYDQAASVLERHGDRLTPAIQDAVRREIRVRSLRDR